MRLFELHRDQDETGISGTGIVAEGIEFSNGKCALCWRTRLTSVTIYDNIRMLEQIHGHGGNTRLVWLEEESSARD